MALCSLFKGKIKVGALESSGYNRLLKYWNMFSWGIFLALLSFISFATDPYKSVQWVSLSAAFYLLSCCCLVPLALGGKIDLKALNKAKSIVLLLTLIIFWQFIQISLPMENSFVSSLFGSELRHDWLQVPATLSITPAAGKWLLLSNLFELSLFCLVLVMVNSRKRLQQIMIVIMVVGLVHGFLAIVAKQGNFYLVDVAELDGHYHAARGLFVNRNHLAAFSSLTLVCALSYLFRNLLQPQNGKKYKLVKAQLAIKQMSYWAALFSIVIVILLSQSRAAFLGLILSAVATLFTLRRYSLVRVRLAWTWVPILLVFICLLTYFGQDLLARLSDEQLSLGERGMQWRITWDAIQQNMLTGYGAGSYAIVFQVWRDFADLRWVVYDQAHNHFLHLWLEQGLIGVCLWIGVLCLSAWRGIAAFGRTKSSLTKSTIGACLLVMCSALLQSLVDYNLQMINIRSYFFVIMALLFVAPSVEGKFSSRSGF